MRTLMGIYTILLSVALRASSFSFTQIIYKAVASLLQLQSVCAVLKRFICITAKYIGPLEAAHERIDDD